MTETVVPYMRKVDSAMESLDWKPFTDAMDSHFPRSFELCAIANGSESPHVPLGIGWQVSVSVQVLEAMGVEVTIKDLDGGLMSPERYAELLAAQVARAQSQLAKAQAVQEASQNAAES